MKTFAIILPTIREDIGFVFSRLFDSFTHKTDVFVPRDIMGQGRGHLQELNYAVEHWIDPARHDIAVKMDDDVLLNKGWQDDIAQAFDDIERLGVCGLDLSNTVTGTTYMLGGMPGKVMIPYTEHGNTLFREIAQGNVGGMIMATPAALMKEIGAIPIVGDNKYPFYADGYYNHRARQLGYRLGYCATDSEPIAVVHDDPDSYVHAKEADTERIRDEAMRLFTS